MCGCACGAACAVASCPIEQANAVLQQERDCAVEAIAGVGSSAAVHNNGNNSNNNNDNNGSRNADRSSLLVNDGLMVN